MLHWDCGCCGSHVLNEIHLLFGDGPYDCTAVVSEATHIIQRINFATNSHIACCKTTEDLLCSMDRNKHIALIGC